jgi:hypothetical protein
MRIKRHRASHLSLLFLALSLSLTAANAAESRHTRSTATKAKQDLPSVEGLELSSSEFLPAFDQSHKVGDRGLAGRLKLDYSVNGGLPLLEPKHIYRFGEAGDETARIWKRDATAAEEVDRTPFASDAGTLRFNFTEWLSCLFVVTVPLKGDASGEEPNGDGGVNDLRVFSALMTTF